MDIPTMMLQVLDDPTGSRIIVETKYPDLSGRGNEYAYFMIDRSDGGGRQKVDENGHTVWAEPEIYDHWQVTDSIGQSTVFNSNAELIEFLDSIEDITTNAWVEGF